MLSRTPAQMSRLLIQINQRSKRTEKMVIEIKNDRAAGVISHSGIELLKDKLPAMPFADWSELLKFEESIASDDGASLKKDLVYKLCLFRAERKTLIINSTCPYSWHFYKWYLGCPNINLPKT